MIVKTVVRPETEMKNSGIEYIGKIPNDWEVRKVGYLAAKITDYVASGSFATLAQNVQYLDEPDYARLIRTVDLSGSVNKQPVYVSKEAYKFLSNSNLFGGELILPNIGSVGCVYQYKKIYEHATLAPNSILLDMKENNRFYFYWFSNPIVGESLKMLGNSTVQVKFNKSQLRQYMLPRPPLSEQQAIADYLDETCSKIDEIIAEAKASIDEYKELKQAVIFDGISLGTKSCCEYKKTTLEGIKKIPVAWEYRKLKFLIKYIESGVSVNAGNEPATELEYGVLKTSCVSKMFFIPSENKSVNKDEYARVKCPVCGNTIIVSRMNTPDLVGACAYIEKNINNIFLPDRLWQVHFNDDVNVKYVYYCLISPYIRNYYSSLSTGTSSSMQNISQGQFANAIIPYPSLEEQKEIVEFLDKRTAEIDSLIAEKESLINDLEAYKKSLIYEVVTGKRKVV